MVALKINALAKGKSCQTDFKNKSTYHEQRTYLKHENTEVLKVKVWQMVL